MVGSTTRPPAEAGTPTAEGRPLDVIAVRASLHDNRRRRIARSGLRAVPALQPDRRMAIGFYAAASGARRNSGGTREAGELRLVRRNQRRQPNGRVPASG